jgi:hypothetical protein
MSDETIVVKLTLRKHVAERLKRMCYARSMTASVLVDSWVFSADDSGNQPKPKTAQDALLELFGGGR